MPPSLRHAAGSIAICVYSDRAGPAACRMRGSLHRPRRPRPRAGPEWGAALPPALAASALRPLHAAPPPGRRLRRAAATASSTWAALRADQPCGAHAAVRPRTVRNARGRRASPAAANGFVRLSHPILPCRRSRSGAPAPRAVWPPCCRACLGRGQEDCMHAARRPWRPSLLGGDVAYARPDRPGAAAEALPSIGARPSLIRLLAGINAPTAPGALITSFHSPH